MTSKVCVNPGTKVKTLDITGATGVVCPECRGAAVRHSGPFRRRIVDLTQDWEELVVHVVLYDKYRCPNSECPVRHFSQRGAIRSPGYNGSYGIEFISMAVSELAAGYTLAEVRKHLREKYGARVAMSTLHNWSVNAVTIPGWPRTVVTGDS